MITILFKTLGTNWYGSPEGTCSFHFLSWAYKLLTRFNNIITYYVVRTSYLSCLNKIITRLNDLLFRTNKLFILFKQDNNTFKRLIMSYAQVSNLF